MHPLDNPAWTALTTHQAQMALVEGMARRFPPEMAVHGALALPMPQAWEAMARLARAPVCFCSVTPPQAPAGWTVVRDIQLYAMVEEDSAGLSSLSSSQGKNTPDGAELVELSEADLPEMSALYAATRPGRTLCPRIQKLGAFLGIRCQEKQEEKDGTKEKKLVAMAGLRMHLPGYREITTVATMPGFEGRGYATALVSALVRRIRDRNERPFLTVRTDNPRAVEIYRRLGFHERVQLHSITVRYGEK
jgi:ribosomal protein S18 acetylase RimI-like enzyme